MTDPTPKQPQHDEESAGQRIGDAMSQTGERLSQGISDAGERVRQFAEEKHINEQLEVAGNQLVERVRQLIDEGNVRRLIIRNQDGRTLLEIPLTAGVAVGGAVFWLNPLLAGLGAIAALLARVSIEIVREEPEATMHDIEQSAQDVKNRLTGGSGSGSSGSSGASSSGGGSSGMGGGSGSSGGSGTRS